MGGKLSNLSCYLSRSHIFSEKGSMFPDIEKINIVDSGKELGLNVSDTLLRLMLLIGFGVPIIAGATAVYLLWRTRNRITLVVLFIFHLTRGLMSPLLGIISWIPMFFTPYAEGYKPEKIHLTKYFWIGIRIR